MSAAVKVVRLLDGQSVQTVFMGRAEARFWEAVDGWFTENLQTLQVVAKSRRLSTSGKKLDLAKSIAAHDMLLLGLDRGDWLQVAEIARATQQESFMDTVKLNYVVSK